MSRIVEGDAGTAICKEAEKVKPIAVVMGTRGRSLMQRYCFSLSYSTYLFFTVCCLVLLTHSFLLHVLSVLQGSVSEYCFHNCKAAPVIIVPGIGMKFEFLSLLLLVTSLYSQWFLNRVNIYHS